MRVGYAKPMMSRKPLVEYLSEREAADVIALAEQDVLCRNPGCGIVLEARKAGSGNLKSFCSDRCRVAFHRGKNALLEAWARTCYTLRLRVTPLPRRQLQKARTQLQRRLLDYGVTYLEAEAPAMPNWPTVPVPPLDPHASHQEWAAYRVRLEKMQDAWADYATPPPRGWKELGKVNI